MKISYDPKVDALYVRFVDGPKEVMTLRLTEDVAVNYVPGGDIVGIEILSAHEHVQFIGSKPQLHAENMMVV